MGEKIRFGLIGFFVAGFTLEMKSTLNENGQRVKAICKRIRDQLRLATFECGIYGRTTGLDVYNQRIIIHIGNHDVMNRPSARFHDFTTVANPAITQFAGSDAQEKQSR